MATKIRLALRYGALKVVWRRFASPSSIEIYKISHAKIIQINIIGMHAVNLDLHMGIMEF